MNTTQWIIQTLREVGEKEHCTVLEDTRDAHLLITYLHKDVYDSTLIVSVTHLNNKWVLSAARPRTGQKVDPNSWKLDDSLTSMVAEINAVHGLFGEFIEELHKLLQSGDELPEFAVRRAARRS
jgi:hypothetical protein